MPAATPLQRTILHALGGACKWAILGKYSFNAFSRGFVDVFLWGVLCSTLPTWHSSTAAFTGYPTLLIYMLAAALIEVSFLRPMLITVLSPAGTDTRRRGGAASRNQGQRTFRQPVPPPPPLPLSHQPPNHMPRRPPATCLTLRYQILGHRRQRRFLRSHGRPLLQLRLHAHRCRCPFLSGFRALFLTALLQILLRPCSSRSQLQFAQPSAVQPPPPASLALT